MKTLLILALIQIVGTGDEPDSIQIRLSEFSMPVQSVAMTFHLDGTIRYEIHGEEVYPPFTEEQGDVWADAMGGEFDTTGIRDLGWNKKPTTTLTLELLEEYLEWCEPETLRYIGPSPMFLHMRGRITPSFPGFIEYLRGKK